MHYIVHIMHGLRIFHILCIVHIIHMLHIFHIVFLSTPLLSNRESKWGLIPLGSMIPGTEYANYDKKYAEYEQKYAEYTREYGKYGGKIW